MENFYPVQKQNKQRTLITMKTNTYTQSLLFVFTIALMAGCSSSSLDKKTQLEELKKQQAQIEKQISKLQGEIAKENPEEQNVRAKEVGIKELTPRPFEHFVQTQGSITAEDNINVSAKSMGVVTKVYANVGESVKAGQVLAQIDNGIILTSIEEVKSQLALAKSVFERQQNLWDQKIGTELQYLQAKTNKESLEKRLASLNEQNEMTRIKSPINGVVDEVFVKQGQNVAPGMPAIRVINFSDLRIKAEISESYVTKINKGDKAKVTLLDIDQTVEAKVTFVSKTINQLSRTFDVEIKLPSNPNFRPNMTAMVSIIFHTEANALVVPINVVQEINGEKIVYVVESDGKNMVARKRVVTVDGVFNGLTQVQGLKAGDKLISVGFQGLNDGEIVKI